MIRRYVNETKFVLKSSKNGGIRFTLLSVCLHVDLNIYISVYFDYMVQKIFKKLSSFNIKQCHQQIF